MGLWRNLEARFATTESLRPPYYRVRNPKFCEFFKPKIPEKKIEKKNVLSRKLKAFERSRLAVTCGKICNSLDYPDKTEL